MTSVQKAVLFFVAVMIGAMVVVPPSVWSDTVGGLNTFEAGETARASEVNQNFSAVETAVDGNDGLISDLDERTGVLESQVQTVIPDQLNILGNKIDAVVGDIGALDEDLDGIQGRVTALEQLPPPASIGATLLVDANDMPIAVPISIGDHYTTGTGNFYGFTFQGRAYHFPVERFPHPDGGFDLLFQRHHITARLYFESWDCSGDAYYALTNASPIFGEAPEGATGGSIPVHVSRNSSLPKTLLLGGEIANLDVRTFESLDGNGGCQGLGRLLNLDARRVVRIVDVATEMPEPLGLIPGFEWGE